MPVSFTEDELRDFTASMVRVAVREAKKAIDEERSEKSQRQREIKTIKDKLSAYRKHKRMLNEEFAEFTETEKAEYRLSFLEDLMGCATLDSERTENMLKAREEKRMQLNYEIQTLDEAIARYKEEVDEGRNDERSRWFRVMYAFYIAPEKETMDQIIEREHIARMTGFRDLDKAAGVILEYII